MKTCSAALLACLLVVTSAHAQAPAKPVPLTDAQKVEKFTKMMTGKILSGSFVSDRRPDSTAPPSKDEYRIESVTHIDGNKWSVNTRVKYEMYNVLVPVPVDVEWAGDTPMIQVTNLTIPNLGSGFTARVLIYEGRYAGTWAHNQVGGQMWGALKDIPKEGPDAEVKPGNLSPGGRN